MSGGAVQHAIQQVEEEDEDHAPHSQKASSSSASPESKDAEEENKNQHYSKGDEDDMTAGMDQANTLPVMTFKVQDKGFDESKSRWSVYERYSDPYTTLNIATGAGAALESGVGSKSDKPHNITSGSLASHTFRLDPAAGYIEPSSPQVAQAHGGSPHTQGVSSRAALRHSNSTTSTHSILRMARNLADEGFELGNTTSEHDSGSRGSSMVLSQPKRNLFLENRHSSMNMVDLEKQLNSLVIDKSTLPYLPRQQSQDSTNQTLHIYPWLQFGALMCVALVVPPVFFLISLGVFDGNNGLQSYYGGMRYYNSEKGGASSNIVVVKKFSFTQKMLSFVIGLAWILIVLAMIGVGLGVGLTRNRS